MALSPKAKPRSTKMKRVPCLASFVQLGVLLWSAAILTAGWLGMIKNADTTFTAGIFTSILANFGVRKTQEDKREEPNIVPPRTRTPPKP